MAVLCGCGPSPAEHYASETKALELLQAEQQTRVGILSRALDSQDQKWIDRAKVRLEEISAQVDQQKQRVDAAREGLR